MLAFAYKSFFYKFRINSRFLAFMLDLFRRQISKQLALKVLKFHMEFVNEEEY